MPLTYFICVDTLLAYCNKSIPANQKNRPFGLCKSSTRDIVEFYNLRGGKERIFDDMNNGFGWNRLPKSFMSENTVFLLLTALIQTKGTVLSVYKPKEPSLWFVVCDFT